MTKLRSPKRGKGSTVRAYIEMTKPRIIELLLITTIPAMVVATRGWPGWWLVAVVLVGGSLSAGGANVINQVYDRDIDRIMNRTSGRPIPTERISPRAAMWFGLSLGVAGFVILAVWSTLLAGVLSVAAFGFYILVYTMLLKRSSTQNIVIGGAAGAVPALIGWAAVTGDLVLAPWIMFAIVLFWTPPHFWALSLKYEDDYRRAGIPMLPVIVGDDATFREIASYSIVTVGVTLLLAPVAQLGWLYSSVAIVGGIVLIREALKLRSDRGRAMRYFGITNLYLAGVFLSMMLDTTLIDARAVSAAGSVLGPMGGVLVLIGMIGVVATEARPQARAHGVSVVRHTVEVGITALFAFGILAAVYLTYSGVFIA